MNYYLVDYENVGQSGLEAISNVTKDDIVILFFNKQQKIELHCLATLNTNIELIETPQGNQELDKHLVSYLGYLIGINANIDYYIVSNDTGFDTIVKFWQKYKQINLQRKAVHKLKKEERAKLNKIENTIPAKDRDAVMQIINKYIDKPKPKSAIYTKMVSMFGQKKGLALYRPIKSLID